PSTIGPRTRPSSWSAIWRQAISTPWRTSSRSRRTCSIRATRLPSSVSSTPCSSAPPRNARATSTSSRRRRTSASASAWTALSRINRPDLNIMTIEDPVEYQLQGISQTPVNPKIDLTFANGLRSFLRQDPDVIMVGEIRDLETAEIAIQASLTGHLVFSTVHTNDAAGAVTRLVDMGVEPFLVASSLMGILAQRLVRVLCKE